MEEDGLKNISMILTFLKVVWVKSQSIKMGKHNDFIKDDFFIDYITERTALRFSKFLILEGKGLIF